MKSTKPKALFPKLSLTRTLREHFISLLNFERRTDIIEAKNGKISLKCAVAFILLPLFLTYLFYKPNGYFTEGTLNLIVTANSIFIGLFLNLIVLLYSMKEKRFQDEPDHRSMLRKRLIHFTFANVSFEILLSIAVVILSLLHFAVHNPTLINIIDTTIIFLLIQVILGILLIMNRLSKLFSIN